MRKLSELKIPLKLMRVSPFIHLVVPPGTLTYYGHRASLVWADVPGQWPILADRKIQVR